MITNKLGPRAYFNTKIGCKARKINKFIFQKPLTAPKIIWYNFGAPKVAILATFVFIALIRDMLLNFHAKNRAGDNLK
jgi:hypothetical protein